MLRTCVECGKRSWKQDRIGTCSARHYCWKCSRTPLHEIPDMEVPRRPVQREGTFETRHRALAFIQKWNSQQQVWESMSPLVCVVNLAHQTTSTPAKREVDGPVVDPGEMQISAWTLSKGGEASRDISVERLPESVNT